MIPKYQVEIKTKIQEKVHQSIEYKNKNVKNFKGFLVKTKQWYYQIITLELTSWIAYAMKSTLRNQKKSFDSQLIISAKQHEWKSELIKNYATH